MLAFDRDEDADKFVETVMETGVVGATAYEDGTWKHFAPLVRAIFKKPTKFCDCKVDKRGRGFTRGKKYGWWVHSCGKPTAAWGRGEHWYRSLGRNLLPVSAFAPEYRGDGNYGVHYKKCDTCGSFLHIRDDSNPDAGVWCSQCGVHR